MIIPLLFEQLLVMLVGIADTFFISRPAADVLHAGGPAATENAGQPARITAPQSGSVICAPAA